MKIKYNKPPLSIPQQIQQMKDRGIIFTDEKKAEIFLSNNNYYKIAFYYKKLKFENNDFEFYCNLYNQDRKLSSLLLKYISIFEDSLKTKYAYCFSNSTNSSHPHLESSLFIKDYDKLKTRWTNTFNDNNQEYKKHYLEKYEETLPPIWVLVESFPLGLLCNTIKKTNHTHLLDFYSSFNYPTKLLSSFFYSLFFVRNLCAHNAIIWNINSSEFPKIPQLIDINNNFNITTLKESNIIKSLNYKNKSNIYNFILIMYYLLKQLGIEFEIKNDFNDFFYNLEREYLDGYGFLSYL